MTSTTDKTVMAWESIIRTVASVLMTGLLGWMCLTLVAVQRDVAVVKVQLPQVVSLTQKVMDLGERVALVENNQYRMEGGR